MSWRVLIVLSISFFLNSCAKPSFSPAIYNQVCIVSKPTIKTLKDAQNAYIDLFEAYEKNLKLLEILKETK